MRKNTILRIFFYCWAFPNTLIGLIITLINKISGGEERIVSGVLEVHGAFVSLLLKRFIPLKSHPLALTLGHVVLGQSLEILERTREHERVHVKQYERYGLFFLPLYALATLIAWMQGKRPYRDNWFEIEAYDKSTIDYF